MNSKSIVKGDFGYLPNGQKVDEYILKNTTGIELKVISYGGIIRCLAVPDKNGVLEDIILGFDDLDGYLNNNYYMGAIIGRYCNRIAGGEFLLDDKKYTLAQNIGHNHLHGGIVGFDKVVWNVFPFENNNSVGLKMRYRSKAMEEGYPGTLDVSVNYSLTNNDELIFEYSAKTDEKTIINLTNHAYYNLAGPKGNVLDCILMINATKFLAIDDSQIPTVLTTVKDTPFDFSAFKRLANDIDKPDDQLVRGSGYDHCWVLEKKEKFKNLAASLIDPHSGRQMDVYTEEPGIQLYTGNFLDAKTIGKDNIPLSRRSAICLETQHFPNSPNRPDFPSVMLEPGETYRSKTITQFTINANY